MKRSRNTSTATLTAVFAAVFTVWISSLLITPAAEATRKDGDSARVSGRIVDAAGKGVPKVAVVLESSRHAFSLRSMKQVQSEPLRQPTLTDDDGWFHFEWIWDRHHNHYELAVGLEVSREGRPGFEILERHDITDTVVSADITELRLELKQVEWVRWLSRYVEGRIGDDEQQLYRDLGRPEKLTVDGALSSWWYFTRGKVYRFDGGRREAVVDFEPIKAPPQPDS